MTHVAPSIAAEPSPLGLLLQAYDHAIAACRVRQAGAAYRHIATLRAAHPCDTPTAAGIDALYAWCERAVLSGDFLGAARTLEQLRGAWQAADAITRVRDLATGGRRDDRHPDDERHTRPTIGA